MSECEYSTMTLWTSRVTKIPINRRRDLLVVEVDDFVVKNLRDAEVLVEPDLAVGANHGTLLALRLPQRDPAFAGGISNSFAGGGAHLPALACRLWSFLRSGVLWRAPAVADSKL